MVVKVFANLRDICGDVTLTIVPDGDRVIDVLEKMIENFPDLQAEIFTPKKTLKPFVHVYINGKNIIHGDNLDTKITENDIMALFPPVAGG